MTLGDYGVDTVSHVAWAVINHNSDFAVVPEPATIALLAAAAAGWWAIRSREQRAKSRESRKLEVGGRIWEVGRRTRRAA